MSAGSQTEIVMPRMGLTMEEGTVVAWLKGVGEQVQAGEPLVEIETDKATVEIESPANGVLLQIVGQPGETFAIGTIIGYLAAPGEKGVALETSPAGEPAKPEKIQVAAQPADGESRMITAIPGKVRASPAARHIARQQGVDLSRVRGSGPDGRIVAWNVEQAIAQMATLQQTGVQLLATENTAKASPLAQRVAEEHGVALRQVQGSGPGGRITRKDVERSLAGQAAEPTPAQPPTGLPPGFTYQAASRVQKRMADRMASSFREAPHFYLHSEADCRSFLALRQALLPRLEERYGVHITVTDLLVKFCALTLERYPQMLSQWSGDGLLTTSDIHIGIATDTPNGLLVPVIQHCNRLGLSEIARQRTELVEKARLGKLSLQELELGTFTISNLGMFKIDFFDAVLNPPQAAILAAGRIKERPLAEDGQLIVAQTMTLSLSVDHRVLDGVSGARFLSDLVELIETPGLALG
jgi:pyruvate dehydrogenase E2 component (dihydrolipoyllysine-residue acetyltransferase)